MSALLERLESKSWQNVVNALEETERSLAIGHASSANEALMTAVIQHAEHPKWEVRLVVARIAATNRHPGFTAALKALAADDNKRVSKAAAAAIQRRRDLAHNSLLAREHERVIDDELDRIEAKHGSQARDAARRTSRLIANIVARELSHEAARLLTPIATTAGTIAHGLESSAPDLEQLKNEGKRLADRVERLTRTLDAMRDFTAQPQLAFAQENLRTLVGDVVQQILDSRCGRGPGIEIDIPAALAIEVDRVRIAAALVNVLANALEAYEQRVEPPVRVSVVDDPSHVTLVISDRGAGMTDEARRDAVKLFTSSKKGGTGFGLPLAVTIVEAEHDGRLLLEARDGGGTIVKVILPRYRRSGS